MRAHLHVEIDVAGDAFPSSSGAWLALGDGGEILAASRDARRFLSLPPKLADLAFDRIFDERFESWHDRLEEAADGVPTRLHGGVRLRVQRLPRRRGARAGGAGAPAAPPRAAGAAPHFGDERLDRGLEEAAWAFRAGLPVLITGETGCGKELVARALHESRERAEGRSSR